MQIKLDLSRHCIETEVKRQYNRSLSEYFKKKTPDDLLERKIENLKEALTTLDFGRLRKTFPALAGHHEDEVILSFDPQNNPTITINGQPIDIHIRKIK